MSTPESTTSEARSPGRPSPAPGFAAVGWVLPPLLLSAVGLGLWLVLAMPEGFFAWAVGFLIALSVLWIFVSTLFPRGEAERTCPACGRDTLVRAQDTSTRGLVCKSCLWSDETRSSFFIAEEEEAPIESTVLAGRRRHRTGDSLVIRPWTGPTGTTRRNEEDARAVAMSPTDATTSRTDLHEVDGGA